MGDLHQLSGRELNGVAPPVGEGSALKGVEVRRKNTSCWGGEWWAFIPVGEDRLWKHASCRRFPLVGEGEIGGWVGRCCLALQHEEDRMDATGEEISALASGGESGGAPKGGSKGR